MRGKLLSRHHREDALGQATDGIAEKCEGRALLLLARLDRRTGNDLGLTASVGPIATKNLAIDDRRPQRLLGPIAGRGNVWLQQEHKPRVSVVVQVTSENVVGLVGAGPRGEAAQAVAVVFVHGDAVQVRHDTVTVGNSALQGLLQQVDDLTREELVPRELPFFQAMSAPQRMSHAQLLQRLLKTVVGGGAVADQPAGVVKADDFLQGVSTAVRVDDVTGGLITDPGMKPDESASVAPTSFIGSDRF